MKEMIEMHSFHIFHIRSEYVKNNLQVKEVVRLANNATQKIVILTKECNEY